MGSFIVNFHIRTQRPARGFAKLEELLDQGGWAAASGEQWLSFWDRRASQQSTERIEDLAARTSALFNTDVIAFLVHDSDVLCYWLYFDGEQIACYNSDPDYFGPSDADPAQNRNDLELLKLCNSETLNNEIEDLLKKKFVFEEERLSAIGRLIGLDENILLTDFEQIGQEIAPEEIGAVWVGPNEPAQEIEKDAKAEIGIPSAIQRGARLHTAAAKGDIAEIERLVAEGMDINAIPNGLTCTALAIASTSSAPTTIRKLVELGADLNVKGKEGATPLRFAVQAGKAENVRTLIESGANAREFDREIGSLLHVAMWNPTVDVMRKLLEAGVNPDQLNAAGQTARNVCENQLRVMKDLQANLGPAAPPGVRDVIGRLEEIEQLFKTK